MSQTLRTFSGSLVALATPFGPDGQVDYKQLEALVEFQLEHHTDGIVALGTTAETPTLSQEEKDKIAQTVIGKVAGRIPVIVGAGSNDTLHAAALARRGQYMVVGPQEKEVLDGVAVIAVDAADTDLIQ